mmetsp:Transcript_3926/g.6477  ORF Transcript_3926/g.6477 Transcript_3926/m.6477 type:complete len:201 (+) Transcript_3926:232-834(+)
MMKWRKLTKAPPIVKNREPVVHMSSTVVNTDSRGPIPNKIVPKKKDHAPRQAPSSTPVAVKTSLDRTTFLPLPQPLMRAIFHTCAIPIRNAPRTKPPMPTLIVTASTFGRNPMLPTMKKNDPVPVRAMLQRRSAPSKVKNSCRSTKNSPKEPRMYSSADKRSVLSPGTTSRPGKNRSRVPAVKVRPPVRNPTACATFQEE